LEKVEKENRELKTKQVMMDTSLQEMKENQDTLKEQMKKVNSRYEFMKGESFISLVEEYEKSKPKKKKVMFDQMISLRKKLHKRYKIEKPREITISS